MLTLVYLASIIVVLIGVIFQNTILFFINNGNLLKTYTELPKNKCKVIKELSGCTQFKHLEGSDNTFAICTTKLDSHLDEFLNPFKYFGLNKINGELKSYNVKSKTFNDLKLESLPTGFKFEPTGFGFKPRSKEGEESIVDFFVINKAELIGYSVEQFEFDTKTNTLTYKKSIQSPKLLKNPKDLVAISKEEFFLVNSNQQSHGLKRSLETIGAFSGGSIIKYTEGELIPEVTGLYAPQSISQNWDSSLIYVLEAFKGKLLIYSRDEEYGDLNLQETVNLDFMPIDLTKNPQNGEIFTVGPTQYHTVLANQFSYFTKINLHLPIPFQVLNIKNETSENIFFGKKFQLTSQLEDNGNTYTLPTGVEWINKNELLLSTNHDSKGALLCKI